MTVKVVIKETEETVTGESVSPEADRVGLFSRIMSDRQGILRDRGRRSTFETVALTVTADSL